MSKLVEVQALKDYLKIEHDEEDRLLGDILIETEALLRQLLKRSIEAVETKEIVRPKGQKTKLFLRNFPVDAEADFSLVDADGNEIDPSVYTLDAATGVIEADKFLSKAYTVTYTGGLEIEDNFNEQILPSLERAIKLWAADTYWHRSPRATSERLGDESVNLEGIEVPRQVALIIDLYRSKSVFA